VATAALTLVAKPAAEPELLVQAHSDCEVERQRINVGGVLVDQVDLAGALDRVQGFLTNGRSNQVVTINLDFLSLAQTNQDFRQTLTEADLAVADGMPLVWLCRLYGTPLAERVAGVDLFSECCDLASAHGWSVFLLGAGPGIADQAALRLVERYPDLNVVGVYTPPLGPLGPEEDARMLGKIREAAPDFLFVALGAPRQDLWIREHLDELHVPVSMGVGCVFDLLAGSVNRAPAWMQRAGLEWAFRLVQEPGRLWRRYLLNDLPMFVRLLLASRQPEAGTGLMATT